MKRNTKMVVAAVIEHQGRILVAQRAYGALAGKWEFPGGKIEDGEVPEEALVREIQEEFGATIEVEMFIYKVPFSVGDKNYELLAYYGKHISGDYEAHDHSRIEWVPLKSIMTMDLAPADIPIAEKVLLMFGK